MEDSQKQFTKVEGNRIYQMLGEHVACHLLVSFRDDGSSIVSMDIKSDMERRALLSLIEDLSFQLGQLEE